VGDDVSGELFQRLDDVLIEESPMHPFGCATWEESSRIAIDMAKQAIRELEARALKAEAERDAALRECGKWATEAGFAIGKLETSELAGVVDDWKARALKAEAERDAARDVLERIAHPEYGIGFNRLRGIARTYLATLRGDQP